MIKQTIFFFTCFIAFSAIACGGSSRQTTVEPGTTMTTDQMPRNVAVETVMPDYRVGIGDVLHISVWKDEALNRDVMVLPDGTISFPLIGRISVNGLTVEALVEVVEDRLDKYVPDPTISVQVLQTISQAVYIIGKVNRPGRFDLPNNLNVLQALALAGGLNPFAKSRHIKIFRETDEGTQIYDFNYEEVSKGEKLTQNIRLQRGDVIVVR